MLARDRSELGTLTTMYQNGTTTVSHPVRKRDILRNIISNKQPAPYVGALQQQYEKCEISSQKGWGKYYVNDHSNPPSTTYSYGDSPVTGLATTWGGITPAQNTESYNNAVAKLNDAIRGNTDLSVDLAQYSKTLAIGRDCTKVVSSLLKARNPIALIKGIGNARLLWVYGMKPTIQSIYDAVHFEAKHYNNELKLFKARGQSVVTFSNVANGSGWPDYTYANSFDAIYSVRDELGVVLRIPDSPLTQLARLSSLNPVSIAWELLPFSFVVDWFVNIGGYVRDLETALTYSSYFSRGYRTTTYRKTVVVKASRNIHYPYRNVYQPQEDYTGDWSYRLTISGKVRGGLLSFPFPSRPALNANLGSGRLLNAAALVSQFLSNPKGKGSSATRTATSKPSKAYLWPADMRLTP